MSGANGILLFYDITNFNTFSHIRNWIELVKKKCDINKVGLVILGNNCQSRYGRKISKQEGQELSDKENAKFLEISTSTGININEAYILLVKEILNKNDNNI